jgi:phosphosulfolactate phosphohydrolase-like enzyme
MTLDENTKKKNIHLQSAVGVDMILKSSLIRKSLDNVTCVMIAFDNFDNICNKKDKYSIKTDNLSENNKEILQKIETENMKTFTNTPLSTKNEKYREIITKIDTNSIDFRTPKS